MKKRIALMLALLMIAVCACASALDIGEFNHYAEMFGEMDLADGVVHESDEGLLLYHYLMTKGSGEEDDHMDTTVSGALFGLTRESDGSFLFMVVK